MSVHGQFLPSIDHLLAHHTLHNSTFIVLKVLCIQLHHVLQSLGVSTLISMELQAGEVIVHMLVTVHLVSHDSTTEHLLWYVVNIEQFDIGCAYTRKSQI